MAEKENQLGSINPLVGRLFRLQDLPGRFGKHLRVPVGRLGIAIDQKGLVRTFPPGEHALLTAWQRLLGKGFGLQTGYIPTSDLIARFRLEYLLSGDGQLLDSSLICALEIVDPARFFSEVVIPRGELRDVTLELSPLMLKEALGAMTTQYAASDLVSGRIHARLTSQAEISLNALLGSLGLRLKEIQLLSISRAENRALLAEKAQALKERLEEVEIQAKMAEIENQNQLEDFLHQVDPELNKIAHLEVTASDKPGDKTGQPGKALRSWLNPETKSGEEKRPWLENIFRKKQEKEQKPAVPKTPRHPKRWWLPRAIWIGFVIALGLSLSLFVNWLANATDWSNRIEVMLIIWGFVISVILESLKALHEKQEAISEDAWINFGFQHLDSLVGNDRQWADAVVREQSASELRHIKTVISEIRSREYQRGKMELALELKNTLERNLEDCAEKVQRADYARPPYVTDLRISQRAWEQMLDNDEDLLLYANALSSKADLLQQKSHTGELNSEMVVEMDAEISKFGNRFFERGRTLQAPTPETIQRK